MRYLSVCSGIEAATVAWHRLGWQPQAFSEIEPFPSAVLTHHYSHIPNLGDMIKYKEWSLENIDLLVGGTPCQSFSVAGLRKGLDDPRGNLALVYCGLAERFRPRWIVWENVPGVLSSGGGRDFGSFLGALEKLGYGWAYRILDAQYFGVPQRRRRVFVVGHLGDWRRAAAVLFERHSLQGHTPPRRQAGERVAGTLKSCAGSGGWSNSADHAAAGYMIPLEHDIPVCMATGQASAEIGIGTTLNCNHEAPIVAFQSKASATNSMNPSSVAPTLDKGKSDGVAVAFQSSQSGVRVVDAHATLDSNNGSRRHNGVVQHQAVRRLTPRECERLQGFPDDYTLVPYRGKPACDGPRYKALGNSMAVPVMRWIGLRIELVERLTKSPSF